MAFRPEVLLAGAPSLAAAALLFLLACVVLAFNSQNRPNRAFALLLTLRGMALLTSSLGAAEGDAAVQRFWFNLYPYFIIPLALAAAYFVAIYPHRRRGVPAGVWGSLPFLAGMVLLDLLYLLDHRMFSDLDAVAAGTSPLRAPAGPLFVFVDLWDLAFAAAALVLARDYVRLPEGPRRRSVLVIGLAFGLLALYDALSGLPGYLPPANPALFAYPGRFVVLTALPAALMVLAAALLARAARAGRVPRAAARRYAAALALPPLTAALVWAAPAEAAPAVGSFANGLWRFAFPLLATYALLRHQLLDIDLKLKWTIKQSTVAAAFIGLFFVVSEAAQAVFSAQVGPLLGIAAAGALVFAIAPLQRAADRVAAAAVPDARARAELSRDERVSVYLDNARVAWADGALDRNERAMLDKLQASLGLSVEEAVRLEREAAGG